MVTAITPVVASRTVALATMVPARISPFCGFLDLRHRRRNGGLRLEPRKHPVEPAIAGRYRRRLHRRRSLGDDRRRLRRRDALDDRFLPRLLRFFLHLLRDVRLLRPRDHVERRRQRLALVQVVVAQPLDRIVGCFEMAVRHQQHVDAEARLHRHHFVALFVQQERRDVDRNLRDDLRGVFLHRFFLQDAQDVQR